MSDNTCPACHNTGIRLLATKDSLNRDDYPCPVCVPWPQGFPGEVLVRKGVTHIVIEPSEPGRPAVWRGFPRN